MTSITNIIIFLVIITLLYSARKLIQNRIQAIVILFGGSKKMSIIIYSFIMLPGVIIHELSHFFAALITGVRTGNITIFPSFNQELDESRIALGSVKIAKTDFIRGSFIGAAPFFVGCIILFSLTAYILYPDNPQLTTEITLPHNWQPKTWQLATWIYTSFVIGNTMFSSKEDARLFPVLLVMLILPLISLIISGNTHLIISHIIKPLNSLTSYLNASFLLVILLNATIAMLLLAVQKIIEKTLKKRVVFK